jgi:hypothetical protein
MRAKTPSVLSMIYNTILEMFTQVLVIQLGC